MLQGPDRCWLLARPLMMPAGDSSTLITASSDSKVKLWDVETGTCTFTFEYKEPCRAVAFAMGEQLAAFSTDYFMQSDSCIRFVRIADNVEDQEKEEVLSITGGQKRFTRVVFTDLNRKLLSSGEDGFVKMWDTEVRPPEHTSPLARACSTAQLLSASRPHVPPRAGQTVS